MDSYTTPLPNVKVNRTFVTERLKTLGYQVINCENTDHGGVREAVDDFVHAIYLPIPPPQVQVKALMYVCGHGKSVDGDQHLDCVKGSETFCVKVCQLFCSQYTLFLFQTKRLRLAAGPPFKDYQSFGRVNVWIDF